jgi:hypothetical protein
MTDAQLIEALKRPAVRQVVLALMADDAARGGPMTYGHVLVEGRQVPDPRTEPTSPSL